MYVNGTELDQRGVAWVRQQFTRAAERARRRLRREVQGRTYDHAAVDEVHNEVRVRYSDGRLVDADSAQTEAGRWAGPPAVNTIAEVAEVVAQMRADLAPHERILADHIADVLSEPPNVSAAETAEHVERQRAIADVVNIVGRAAEQITPAADVHVGVDDQEQARRRRHRTAAQTRALEVGHQALLVQRLRDMGRRVDVVSASAAQSGQAMQALNEAIERLRPNEDIGERPREP
jgi:hypothetical protein